MEGRLRQIAVEQADPSSFTDHPFQNAQAGVPRNAPREQAAGGGPAVEQVAYVKPGTGPAPIATPFTIKGA